MFRKDQICRPPVGNIEPSKDNLIFQQIELDHYVGAHYPGMPGAQTGLLPIMRMYGVTENGNSVCCHVHGFTPYFYVSLPDDFTNSDLPLFKVRFICYIL